MMRKALTVAVALAGALAAEKLSAFSMMGPVETWQSSSLDYPGDKFIDFHYVALNLATPTYFDLRLGAPKNLGEEYRLNTPIITYAYDNTFLEYFGAEGVKAVDSAFAFMNSLPSVSSMSASLAEYPTEGNFGVNYRAKALRLVDLRSLVIQLLVEHTGLGGDTHVFDLTQRISTTTTCVYYYTYVLRNFDPITWQPSRYINGNSYTMQVYDDCSAGIASATEINAEASDDAFTTVATPYTLGPGVFYTSLTRDDMGGLRYLLRNNNYNREILATNSSAGTLTSASASSPWSIPSFFLTNSTTTTGTGTGTGATTGTAQNGTNDPAMRGGIEKVTYVRTYFDSQVGSDYTPVVAKYTVPVLINNKVVQQKVTRTINAPDILIRAEDFTEVIYAASSVSSSSTTGASPGTIYTTGGNSPIGSAELVYRAISFQNTSTNFGTTVDTDPAGPGIIHPGFQMTFNKMGPSFITMNYYEDSDGDAYGTTGLGIFGGTDAEPIVFPNTGSIRELEEAVTSEPSVNVNSLGSLPSTWSADIINWSTLSGSSSSGNSSGNNGQ